MRAARKSILPWKGRGTAGAQLRGWWGVTLRERGHPSVSRAARACHLPLQGRISQ